jgi:hypothetical protein
VSCTTFGGRSYNQGTALTISKVRQNLFALADAASRGEKVQFNYKGNTFQLVAEKKPSKLARLARTKPLFTLAPGDSIGKIEADWQKVKDEMYADWEKKSR